MFVIKLDWSVIMMGCPNQNLCDTVCTWNGEIVLPQICQSFFSTEDWHMVNVLVGQISVIFLKDVVEEEFVFLFCGK